MQHLGWQKNGSCPAGCVMAIKQDSTLWQRLHAAKGRMASRSQV